MSVEIIETKDYKVLICNTTMVAFGDVFYDDEPVEDFLQWLTEDARTYSQKELSCKTTEWRDMRLTKAEEENENEARAENINSDTAAETQEEKLWKAAQDKIFN